MESSVHQHEAPDLRTPAEQGAFVSLAVPDTCRTVARAEPEPRAGEQPDGSDGAAEPPAGWMPRREPAAVLRRRPAPGIPARRPRSGPRSRRSRKVSNTGSGVTRHDARRRADLAIGSTDWPAPAVTPAPAGHLARPGRRHPRHVPGRGHDSDARPPRPKTESSSKPTSTHCRGVPSTAWPWSVRQVGASNGSPWQELTASTKATRSRQLARLWQADCATSAEVAGALDLGDPGTRHLDTVRPVIVRGRSPEVVGHPLSGAEPKATVSAHAGAARTRHIAAAASPRGEQREVRLEGPVLLQSDAGVSTMRRRHRGTGLVDHHRPQSLAGSAFAASWSRPAPSAASAASAPFPGSRSRRIAAADRIKMHLAVAPDLFEDLGLQSPACSWPLLEVFANCQKRAPQHTVMRDHSNGGTSARSKPGTCLRRRNVPGSPTARCRPGRGTGVRRRRRPGAADSDDPGIRRSSGGWWYPRLGV